MTNNRHFLPYGASEIIDLRKSGKRPSDMVLVSLIGPLREVNPVVVANPCREYDWRFIVDLDVLVVVDSKTSRQAVRHILEAIKVLPANSLSLWIADRNNGRHLIIDGVVALPSGLLRYMDAADCRNYAGIGKKEHEECM